MQLASPDKGIIRALCITVLLFVTSLSFADEYSAHLKFIGNLTQLRKGLSNNLDLDLITPKDVGGQPICLKRSEDLKITWVDPTPGAQWKVVQAILKSDVDGTIHWSMAGPTGYMNAGTIWDLPGNMPYFVDKCTLTIEIVAITGLGGIGGEPGTPPPVVGSNKVYITVTDPVDLMAVPWTNMLDWSTVAAHGTQTKYWANYNMTNRLWDQGKFDPSKQWFAVSPFTIHQDTFYLRRFLEAGLIGRSSDFGDFLTCAMMSHGVDNTSAARSYPNEKRMGAPYPTPPSGKHFEIVSKIVKRAGQDSESAYTAPFHQFADWGGYYWDGSNKYYDLGFWETAKGYPSANLKKNLVNRFRADIDFDNVSDIDVSKGSPDDPWAPKKITIVLNAEAAPGL